MKKMFVSWFVFLLELNPNIVENNLGKTYLYSAAYNKACFKADELFWNSEMWENFPFGSLTNHLNVSEFSVAFTIDLSNRFAPPFVASTKIPRFLFAGWYWVAVFYAKVRVTNPAAGRGLQSKPDCRMFLGSFLLSGLVTSWRGSHHLVSELRL